MSRQFPSLKPKRNGSGRRRSGIGIGLGTKSASQNVTASRRASRNSTLGTPLRHNRPPSASRRRSINTGSPGPKYRGKSPRSRGPGSSSRKKTSKKSAGSPMPFKFTEEDEKGLEWDGTMLGDGKDNVNVCVRMRPHSALNTSTFKWDVSDTSIQASTGMRKPFYFERVFTPISTNKEVYQAAMAPLVHQVLKGFNATFFCYGQTGSGKTHTIYGSPSEPGVCPLTVLAIFKAVRDTTDTLFLIRCSYMEIYNEELNDLLNPSKKKLAIRESNGVFHVADLTERIIKTPDEVFQCIHDGNVNRSVGVSNLNEHSSRSHSIFRLIIESATRTEGKAGPNTVTDKLSGSVRVSELNLVDLAGSETLVYDFGDAQQKETKFINGSLTQLKSVIKALSQGASFVQYRNSQLTKLLKNSLGGNAKTTLVCTMHPHPDQEKMSKGTLNFGDLARKIKNRAKINEEFDDSKVMLKQYRKKIQDLEAKLGNYEAINAQKLKIQRDYEALQAEIARLREQENKQRELQTEVKNFGGMIVNNNEAPPAVVIVQEPSISDEQMKELNDQMRALEEHNKTLSRQLELQKQKREQAEKSIAAKQKALLEEQRIARARDAELDNLRKQKREIAEAQRRAAAELARRMKEAEEHGLNRDVYLANLIADFEQQIFQLRRENEELLSLREVIRCDAEEKMRKMLMDHKREVQSLQNQLASQAAMLGTGQGGRGGGGAGYGGSGAGHGSGYGRLGPDDADFASMLARVPDRDRENFGALASSALQSGASRHGQQDPGKDKEDPRKREYRDWEKQLAKYKKQVSSKGPTP